MKSRNFVSQAGIAVLSISIFLTFIVSWAYWVTILGGVIFLGALFLPREEDGAWSPGFRDLVFLPSVPAATHAVVWVLRIMGLACIIAYFALSASPRLRVKNPLSNSAHHPFAPFAPLASSR